jgi:hypothetical protein
MRNATKISRKDIVQGAGFVSLRMNRLRLVTEVNDGTCHYRQLNLDDGGEVPSRPCSIQSMVRWCDRIATKTEISMINLEDPRPEEKALSEIFNQFMPDVIEEGKRSEAAGSKHKILHFDFKKGDTLAGRLEETVNVYAELGWEVVSFNANDVETGPAILILKRPL